MTIQIWFGLFYLSNNQNSHLQFTAFRLCLGSEPTQISRLFLNDKGIMPRYDVIGSAGSKQIQNLPILIYCSISSFSYEATEISWLFLDDKGVMLKDDVLDEPFEAISMTWLASLGIPDFKRQDTKELIVMVSGAH